MKRGSKATGASIIGNRWLRIGLIASLIIAGIAGWYKYNQNPVSGTIIQSTVLSAEDPAEPQSRHFKGAHVGFDYPAEYGSVQSNPPNGRVAEQYSLSAKLEDLESRRISLTVNKLAAGVSVREDSAYKFRAADPNIYHKETATINGQSVDKFSKLDGAEVTYFLPGGEYYAIVSATSTRPGGDFIADAAAVVSSLTWQQL